MIIKKSLNHIKVHSEPKKKFNLFKTKENFNEEYYTRHVQMYLEQELKELQQEYADLLYDYEKAGKRIYKERQQFAEILLENNEMKTKADAYDKIVRVAESNNYGNVENQIARIKSYIHQQKARSTMKDSK